MKSRLFVHLKIRGAPCRFAAVRRYTEVPELCDAVQDGRFAPHVPPAHSLQYGVCVDLYRERMQPSYVLALPQHCADRLQWLQRWTASHGGHGPYDLLSVESDAALPALLFRGAAQLSVSAGHAAPAQLESRPLLSVPVPYVAGESASLDEQEWYDAMEDETLRASALMDRDGKTCETEPDPLTPLRSAQATATFAMDSWP